MFGLRGCCSVGLSGFASGCPWLSLYRVNRKVALIVGGRGRVLIFLVLHSWVLYVLHQFPALVISSYGAGRGFCS